MGPHLPSCRIVTLDIDDDRLMHETVREVIGLMVTDVLETTRGHLERLRPQTVIDIRHADHAMVDFSPSMMQNVTLLRTFLRTRMYRHSKVNRILCQSTPHCERSVFVFYGRAWLLAKCVV